VWGVGAEDGESRGTSHSREGRAGLPARPPQTAPRKAQGIGEGRPSGGKVWKDNRRRQFRMPGTQGMRGGAQCELTQR